MDFFNLSTHTMNPSFLTHEARAEARRTWMCNECASVRLGVEAVDVWLQDRRPADKPLNFVYGPGVPLVHKELLDLFGEDNVRRDLYVGRVFGSHGKELDDWVTARGRRRVILRGTRDASFRICSGCDRVLYSTMGNRYLSPLPPPDATIYESHLHGFVVPEEISELVAAKGWRRLKSQLLPVLDPPPDGLGVLPDA